MLLKDLKIWDGSGFIAEDAIEIGQGGITRLFESNAGTQGRSCAGMYLMPGLIDAHVHMCLDPETRDPLAQITDKAPLLEGMSLRAEKMVKAGITTARDLGGGHHVELTLRDQIAAGEKKGPRLVCAGQPITSVMGHCHFWNGEAADQGEVMEVLERQLACGVDLIKVMATGGSITAGSNPGDAQFDADVIEAIVDRAREADRYVAAHCHGTTGISHAASAGVRTIEHCSWVGATGWGRDRDDTVIDTIVKNDVWVSPTINAGWQRHVGKGAYEEMIQSNYKAMKDAGVRLIASTDAGIPNVFHADLAKALPVFAHFAGLSNEAVLTAATRDCADAIGVGEVTGSVQAGYSADLLLLDSAPTLDLQCLQTPVEVFARGIPQLGSEIAG